jgi:hypothetical protein
LEKVRVWMLNRCWVLGCGLVLVLDAGLGMDKMEASFGVEGIIGRTEDDEGRQGGAT